MAVEPTYPDDAPVGGSAGEKPPGSPAAEGEKTEAEKGPESKRARQIVTGAAIGIGSAALVAALLYANRSRGAKKDERE